MSDSTHGAPDGLVRLDEWHLALSVDHALPGEVAEEVRWLLDAELTAWAHAFVSQLEAAPLIRVDVER